MSPDIQNLIYLFSKLPGLGGRSAQRIVLHLLKHKGQILSPLSHMLSSIHTHIKECHLCFNWDTTSPCSICHNTKRDPKLICVVENVSDLWAIERAQIFKGQYHVLGGVLSAIDGITPDQLHLGPLWDRLKKDSIDEVILALNATIEGQTTLSYIIDSLKTSRIPCSMLAQGVPMGGELDYLDHRTIGLAFDGRTSIVWPTRHVQSA